MLERFPKNEADKLRALNLSEEQLKARLAAIAKLDSYINDDIKFSRGDNDAGFTSFLKHMASTNETRKSIQDQMKAIRPMLLESFEKNNNSNGWDKIINTSLNYIEADGSANLETRKTRMSQRMFLQKIIGPTTTAVILQDNNELPQLEETQIQQKSRLQQFLLVLEQKEQSGEIGSKIRHTNYLLSKNKIDEAITYAR